MLRLCLLLLPILLLLLPLAPAADDAPKAKTWEVPYKTTIPKHIAIRVKINKKGPFNFILDTGAPAMFIATKVGKKAGLDNGADGWAVMDRLEIEGGPVLLKTKARVETPFQLEGMNGMGMAGFEIHGMIGYSILAKYRMEIDMTRDKMTWTELDHDIVLPKRIGKGAGAPGGLEMMGSMMKTFGGVMGRKANPDITLRGFFGMAIDNGDEFPQVSSVLEDGPAGKGGLRKGDLITKVQDRTVTNVADLLKESGKYPAGKEIKLTIKRGEDTKEITIKTGEGI